jgi:hypothetical protein
MASHRVSFVVTSFLSRLTDLFDTPRALGWILRLRLEVVFGMLQSRLV